MKIFNKTLIAGGLIASLVLAGTAFAQDKNHEDKAQKVVRPTGSSIEVSINDNGKTTVRGAKVTSVSGSNINTSVTFGSLVMNWAVQTDTSTKFVEQNGRSSSLASIKVGDLVSFSGTIDSSAATLSVKANTVRDWTQNNALLEKRVFEGKVKSVAGATLPSTMVLTVGGTDYTVNVSSNISILNKFWLITPWNTIKVGDTVRVYGAIQAANMTTIDASVVRDTSI